MNSFFTELKNSKEDYKLINEPFKSRIKLSLTSLFITLLFVISPVLIVINLFIFYDFIPYNILLLILLLNIGVFLFDKFYFEGLRNINEQALSVNFKFIRIENLCFSLLFSIVGYIIAMIIIY